MISIVVVNWNGALILPYLLQNLKTTQFDLDWNLNIVIVDNASTDDSLEIIKQGMPDVKLVESIVNLGFAGGCNLGAKYVDTPYILFLNPDTQISARSLNDAINFMSKPEHKDVGILGVQLMDELGNVARTCARFPRAQMFLAQNLGLDRLFPQLGHTMREWTHSRTREVDQVIGAFFLTRRNLFAHLGGFDDRFFVYFEEVDYAYRARQLGFKSIYLANTRAFHKGEGTTSQIKGRRLFYSLRSRLLYGRKHYSLTENVLNFANTLLLEPLSRCAFLLFSGRRDELPALREGFVLLYRDLLNILLRRMRP